VALKLRVVRTRRINARSSSNQARELLISSRSGRDDNLFDDPGYAQVKRELHDMMRAARQLPLAEPIGMA
jgi:hypothetical protein